MKCHSSSTALETKTGYWKPTQRGTDETPPWKKGFEQIEVDELSVSKWTSSALIKPVTSRWPYLHQEAM